jgi:hypothetical protein
VALWLLGLALCSAIGGGALRAEGMPDPASGVACLGTLYLGQLPDLPGARLQLVRQGERLRGHALYAPVAPGTPAGARGEGWRRELDGRVDADGQFVLNETEPDADGDPVAGRFAGAFDAAGVAAGQWESAAGDRRLAFLLTPTDRAGTADSPAFALSCRPDADGVEQVYLEIGGQAPLPLRGVEGESLRDAGIEFDPASLSVRRLEGEPPLLAIEYDHEHAFEAGGASIEYRHALVVLVGEGGGALVDRWPRVLENNRGGFFGSSTADVAIDYRGSTLRVVETRFEGDGFEDDIHEPGEEGYRPPWKSGTLYSLTQELDARTGTVQSQQRLWASTGNLRLIDDGRSGWLLVGAGDLPLLDWGPGETIGRQRLPDPLAIAALPAANACWLYNRRPWQPADAGLSRPPARPGQVRPAQAVPEHCCAVETSTDGRWIGIHESRSAEESDQPGRLLALYDTRTQQCWSANLVKDGPLGRAPFERMSDPVFSPDGQRLGFRAERGEARLVVVDDRAGPSFHRVSPPVFSPDSRHVAYWARDKGKEFAVLDGKRGPGHDGAGLPVFRADGRLVYRVRDGARWRVMDGDTPGPGFDDIGWFRVDPTGRTNDIADLVLSPRGELAYVARRGSNWLIVRDHKPEEPYRHVGLPVYSPHGNRLAFRARQDDRERIVLDGRPGPVFDFVGTPVFSPDGQTLAYWAREGDQQFVIWGGHRGPAFAAPGGAGAPVFADDGRGPFYEGRRAGWRDHDYWESWVTMEGDREVVESKPLDGTLNLQTGEVSTESCGRVRGAVPVPFDEMGTPVQSPAGDRRAYRARVGEVWLPIVEPVAAEAPDKGAGPIGQPPAATAPPTGTWPVPHLLTHPFAIGSDPYDFGGFVTGGWIVGGSVRGHWINIESLRFNPDRWCLPLGPEWIDPGPPWRLYAFDRPLGACSAQAPVACAEGVYYQLQGPRFSGCKIKDYLFAVAGDWNALPRRPRVIEDLGGFVAPVQRVLAEQGLDAATAAIRWAHAIDLDGDGEEERVVHARIHSREAPSGFRYPCAGYDEEDDYPLLLLLGAPGGKDEARVAYAWWPGDRGHCYPVRDAFYADANGDGRMEIFLPRLGDTNALMVYELKAGRPVPTPIYFAAP